MRIVLIGGSGLLGRELCKLNQSLLAPSHAELDIVDASAVLDFVSKANPDVVLHAAGATDNRLIEKDPINAIEVNIKGTANVAIACLKAMVRLVYTSTDYVYRGDRGNYREEDEVLPCNTYAWTKLAGEASVRCVPNHLIIRTSFSASESNYETAFDDKWTSKDYVDVIAPMILEATASPLTGIVNLATSRKTIFDHLRQRNPTVKPGKREDSAYGTSFDTSLNLERWVQYKAGRAAAKEG